jgi:hypothetical protein
MDNLKGNDCLAVGFDESNKMVFFAFLEACYNHLQNEASPFRSGNSDTL